jgi:hypothetical protein
MNRRRFLVRSRSTVVTGRCCGASNPLLDVRQEGFGEVARRHEGFGSPRPTLRVWPGNIL